VKPTFYSYRLPHAPSLAAVERIRALAPDRVDVIIDAAQGRVSRRGLGNVLRQGDKPSVKMVDVTPIAKQSLDQRWLVFRFEQEGLRIENTGQDDFYQLNSEPDTVRLTLSGKGSAAREVSTHYTTNSGDGEYGYNLITDMPKNLLGDMPKNLLGDMPKNLITDTPDSQNNPPPADAHGAD